MRIIDPSYELFFFVPEDGFTAEQMIERVARNCYKSEDKITEESAGKFVRMLRERGHHAMLEFGYAVAHIVADRGLSHELVRHRLASFAQESTRYCNYLKGKFGSEIAVIKQPNLTEEQQEMWMEAIAEAERWYMLLIKSGVKAQIARSVLPIGLRAEINIGANLREWRHIFRMRCAKAAHPIIRGIMLGILGDFNERMPAIYEDLAEEFL
jgi:thymidylate synthase (FAD)